MLIKGLSPADMLWWPFLISKPLKNIEVKKISFLELWLNTVPDVFDGPLPVVEVLGWLGNCLHAANCCCCTWYLTPELFLFHMSLVPI